MKTFKYFISAISTCLLAASCSLSEISYTEVEKDKYMNNADEANNVLLGVYRNMMKNDLYAYHLSMYFTLPTDQAKVEGNSLANFRNVPSNHYTATEDEVEHTWQALYNAVYDANDFIERLSVKVKDYSDADKNRAAIYMGEARTLRALYYFELVRWYGNVALITSTKESYNHPSTFTQASPQTVYEYIEKDLLYAINVLPYASDDTYRKNNAFRISKGGALGLLTKVYATWAGYPVKDDSKWEKAAKTAKQLVESGKHGLLEDYNQLWVNTNNNIWDSKESLLEVSFYSPTITGTSANDPSGRIGKWNGVAAAEGTVQCIRVPANWQVIPTFLWKWENHKSDKRWAISFADYKYNKNGKVPILKYKEDDIEKEGTFEMAMSDEAKPEYRKAFNSSLNPAKWDIEKYTTKDNVLIDANFSNSNWYLLRYADVLLLYAEAMNEWQKGPTQEAYEAINMVRRRAFGLPIDVESSTSDLTKGMSYQDFQQAVRDERSHELAFEGHRRQDLIRWGIYADTIKETYIALGEWHEDAPNYYQAGLYTIKGKNELLPIPQRDLDLMPKFKQNQGW